MRTITLALCLMAAAQDKPGEKQRPSGAAPTLRGLLECQPHRMKEEFDALGRTKDSGNVTTDACSLEAALKRARAWVDGTVKPDAVGALKADPAGKTASSLIGLAGIAAARGKMGAVVAALLEALALDPENPLALSDLAAALAAAGLCSEAIAVADVALPKSKDKLGPLGIPIAAIALNARGFALLRQGKPLEALPALRRAVALAGPIGSDAAFNLALALKETKEEEEAKKVFLMACWRQSVDRFCMTGGRTPKAGDPPRSPFDRGVTTREPAAVAFDLSKGKEGKFPTFRQPQNVRQFKAFEIFYKREEKDYLEFKQKFQAWTAARAKETPGTTPADKRAHMVVQYVELIDDDPDIAPLFEAMNKGGEDLAEQFKRIMKPVQAKVIEIVKSGGSEREIQAKLLESANSVINEVNGPCNSFDDLLRKYWAKSYRYQFGLAANIKSPLWHERASGRIRLMQHTVWFRLVKTCYDLYNIVYGAHSSPKETAGDLELPEHGPEEEEPPECPHGLEGASLEYGFAPLSITVSCESLGVELSTEGMLQGFASVDFSWKGKITVFAGAKAEVDTKGMPLGFTARSGVYMTCDQHGTMEDFGGRVNFEAYQEQGLGVRVKQSIDNMDFSLMPRAQ